MRLRRVYLDLLLALEALASDHLLFTVLVTIGNIFVGVDAHLVPD